MSYEPPAGSIPTLEVPDLAEVRVAHLVGIGGAGMSGIARLLLARGLTVTGSDLKESSALALLRGAGAVVGVGHAAERVGDADTVVVSSAIGRGNPEVTAARERGIPVLARAQVLAALMRERRGIAVAGTHGKTTTTSMVAVVLEAAGLAPTFVIGGDLNESGSNARWGDGLLFVAEADESDGSFLLMRPEIGIVTNVEADHMDHYPDLESLEAAFTAFCASAARVVVCADDAAAVRVAAASGSQTVTYGEDAGADVRVEDPRVSEGRSACTVRFGDGLAVDLTLSMPGRHYLRNAAGALAAGREAGADPVLGAEALAAFTGVRRRFEHRGSASGATFVDDYAHHPTEVAVTLEGARLLDPRRLVAVFQPHRYSRTASMWRTLGESLSAADVVVVTDVYGAGELPMPGVTGKLLIDALLDTAPGARAVYLPSRGDVAPYLARVVREGDLVLTLGAGDITMVGEETIARLQEARRG